MAGSIEEFPSQPSGKERDIRRGSLGFGALPIGESVVRYTVIPHDSPLLADGEKVARYDDEMLLVSSDVPTRPAMHGLPHVLTETEVVRDFIAQEQSMPQPEAA